MSIAVEDVSFTYRGGDDELFGGLTHRFATGSVTALTGSSGRGKSTLLYLLALMVRPTRGAVVLDGRPLENMADAERSRLRATRIGLVFQDAALDPARPVLQSVAEPGIYAGRRRSETLARGRALLGDVGLGHRADHRPGQISGGQAQRVAIARALINEPSIVLADEPTGNLDRDNATAVLGILDRVAREGRTVVIATHDAFVVERSDAVVAL